MNSLLKFTFSVFAIFLLSNTLFAQEEFFDHVESPYLKAETSEGEKIELPLKSSIADVKIAGVIAEVNITQVYENNTDHNLNGEYVFPGSSKSAVYGMIMRIGDREIIAEVKEKEEAKDVFEKAKAEGKKASLLQQHRPNVFQMSVANIGAGEKIEVILSYTELLVPKKGVYEFILPTDVGERYVGEGHGDADWVANPHVSGESENVEYNKPYFDISVLINSGMPIGSVNCPSHTANVDFIDKKSAIVKLKNPGPKQIGPDFIVRYKLSGNKIETGLLCYEGENENFFLYMAQPPQQYKTSEIPPREYIFIVDVSGSMNGAPIEISKDLMRNLISNLRDIDKFNVLLFASGSSVFANESVAATSRNLKEAIAFIDKEHGTGGTDLLPAMKKAMGLKQNNEYSTSFVLVTDGFVTVETEAFDFVRNNLGDANFFPFGIGSNVNRYLIEGLAHVGNCEPLIITNLNESTDKANAYRDYIKSPLLTQVKVEYDNGFSAYDAIPENQGDLFAEKPILVFGKYKKAEGLVRVKGTTGLAEYTSEATLENANISKSNAALKYLWARHKIALLSDYENAAHNEENKSDIIDLGIKYNLLSKYTSFVAVDDVPQQIQPNQNVSFGFSSSSNGAVPEPHEWFFILLIGSVLVYVVYQRVIK
ncbi:MAG: VIT and vWA domain-containing protein [Bacteroidia bacterium]